MSERRLSDLVSVGVLTRTFPPELVDEVIAACGRTEQRHRALPARVLVSSDEGWIYICGRADDHVVVRGQNLYAPAIEAVVSGVAGVRSGRVTAFGTPTGEWIIAVETKGAGLAIDDSRLLADEVRRAAVSAVAATPDEVILLPAGRLPMTSSGKVSRNAVRQRWLAGSLVS